jgi:type IV pilus assembly protein PilM
MEILPKTLGTRPRLAVEVRAEGVVAARAEDASALLTAVARGDMPEGAVVPGLKAGNIVDRDAVIAALRKALDGVAGRGGERGRLRDVTLVVPDSAARVLFLDFDQLPSKTVEALPVVRFRLKKLLPFDADDAVVTYQVMSNEKGAVKLLAVAMPKAVLQEYEGVVMAAGYLPGAVLPSTLAALAGLDELEAPALVVNAGAGAVTTAIVQAGILMLHRSVDMSGGEMNGAVEAPVVVAALPLVDRESSAQEWAQQEALGPGGWDRFDAEAAMQTSVLETAMVREAGVSAAAREVAQAVSVAAREVAQAVSVAAAYFEDSLQHAPVELLVAGTLGAEALAAMMEESGLEGLRVREMVDASMMEAGAVTASVQRGWLAGVRGALRN